MASNDDEFPPLRDLLFPPKPWYDEVDLDEWEMEHGAQVVAEVKARMAAKEEARRNRNLGNSSAAI